MYSVKQYCAYIPWYLFSIDRKQKQFLNRMPNDERLLNKFITNCLKRERADDAEVVIYKYDSTVNCILFEKDDCRFSRIPAVIKDVNHGLGFTALSINWLTLDPKADDAQDYLHKVYDENYLYIIKQRDNILDNIIKNKFHNYDITISTYSEKTL